MSNSSPHFEALFPWFKQYLNQLKREINSYQSPARMWVRSGEIPNSGGNLCTHLLGNLNYFVGTVVGKTGYIRQRDLEFSIKDVPVGELNAQIEDTLSMLRKVLSDIPNWEAPYPPNDYDKSGTVHNQMLRILAHLAYHIGQINYHRRLLDE